MNPVIDFRIACPHSSLSLTTKEMFGINKQGRLERKWGGKEAFAAQKRNRLKNAVKK